MLRVATSAVTGGFVHLYTGLDNRIFEKYGLKCEHVYIRGQSPALAALANDQVQFNYGAADGSLPGIAAGVDAKFVASPLVKLPYVMVARKEIRRPEDLKGKSIGVTRPGDLSARLSRQVVRKFGLTADDVTIHPIGGSQQERYQAMVGNVVQAILVTPPLDVRAKSDGFNVIYRLIDLDIRSFTARSSPIIDAPGTSRDRAAHGRRPRRDRLLRRKESREGESGHRESDASKRRRGAAIFVQRIRERNRRPHDDGAGKIDQRSRRDCPRHRHDHQKETRRALRQQLRHQFGKERLSEGALG
jgi:hypothetical protein